MFSDLSCWSANQEADRSSGSTKHDGREGTEEVQQGGNSRGTDQWICSARKCLVSSGEKSNFRSQRLTQGSKTVQRADTQGVVAAFCEKCRDRERTNTSGSSFLFIAIALSSRFVPKLGDKALSRLKRLCEASRPERGNRRSTRAGRETINLRRVSPQQVLCALQERKARKSNNATSPKGECTITLESECDPFKVSWPSFLVRVQMQGRECRFRQSRGFSSGGLLFGCYPIIGLGPLPPPLPEKQRFARDVTCRPTRGNARDPPGAKTRSLHP